MGMAGVSACATNDFTKCVGALARYIGPRKEGCKNYPNLLFGRNIVDGCGVMGSVLTLAAGGYQGMGDVDYGNIYDVCFLPEFLRLFGGPSCNIMGMMNMSVCTADGCTKCVGALGTASTRGGRSAGSPTRTCSSTATSPAAAA